MNAPAPSARPSTFVSGLSFALLTALFVAALAEAKESTPSAVAGAEHVVIYRKAGQYSAFPSMYQLHDGAGTLYVHFGAGVTGSHLEPRREELRFISGDGGRTWRRATRRETNPAWATGPTHPGRLVVPDAYGWRYVDKSRRGEFEQRGIEVRDSPDGRVTYAYGCHLRTSEDGGATWKDTEIPVPPEALIMTYHDTASYVRLDERTILRAVYGKPANKLPTRNIRFYEAWLLRSEDDGATWTFQNLAADPEKKRSFGETAIARAANGDIVAMMRTEPALGTKMWTTRSSDRGRTWTKPVETPLHGHPAHLLTLRDGTLLCTYGFRDEPIGIRAAFSHDHGRTWPENEIVSLRADGSGGAGNNGYPLTAELADGTLVTVYYLTREGITGVEATRWKTPRK